MAAKHEEEIDQLFGIINQHAEEIHTLKVKLAKLMGEPEPEPMPAVPTPEELAAIEEQKQIDAQEAELLSKLEALKAKKNPLSPFPKSAGPMTPEQELQKRRDLLKK